MLSLDERVAALERRITDLESVPALDGVENFRKMLLRLKVGRAFVAEKSIFPEHAAVPNRVWHFGKARGRRFACLNDGDVYIIVRKTDP